MTHARKPSHDASDNRASVEDLPVLDDALRDLSTLLQLPWDCRRRRCRATKRCQGGEGPPCFHRYRAFIAHSIEQSGLRGLRRFWQRQRALAAAGAGGAGGATADSKRPPPQRSGRGRAAPQAPPEAGLRYAEQSGPRPGPLPRTGEGDYGG